MAESDYDNDGLLLAQEIILETDPNDADSDDDGLDDGVEVYELGTSPYLADSDSDLIPDKLEVQGFQFGGTPILSRPQRPRHKW